MAYGLARNINGISINGVEFVLDDDGNVLKFDTPEDVKKFSAAKLGAVEKDFDDNVYQIIRLEKKNEKKI